MVRKVLIIVLCSVLTLENILPNVDLADLSHLPELFSHFHKHRSQSPGLSFAEFLSLHYDDANHLAATPADHKDLPFSKRQHHRTPLQIAQELIPVRSMSASGFIMKIEGTIARTMVPLTVATQVWQPPRA